MAAFMDEDMNILHINTFVFNASSANVEYFCCKKKEDLCHVLMVRELHISKFRS